MTPCLRNIALPWLLVGVALACAEGEAPPGPTNGPNGGGTTETPSYGTKTEFELCAGNLPTAPTQGDCAEGLHCVPIKSQLLYPEEERQFCLTPCLGESDVETCGDNRCVTASGLGSYCFKNESRRDQTCFENLSWCTAEAGDCLYSLAEFYYANNQWWPINSAPRCKYSCDTNTIGSQGDCPQDELCMTNPGDVYVAQNDADCTSADDCAEGYECFPLLVGYRCIQWVGHCGTPVALCGYADANAATSCLADDSLHCTPSPYNGHGICTITESSTDRAENTGKALPQCLDTGTGNGVCFAGCETTHGDADCGEGYECIRPNTDAYDASFFVMYQRDENFHAVPCTDDPSACDDGYTCKEQVSGSFCVRPGKQCRLVEGSGGASNDGSTIEEGRLGGVCYDAGICNIGLTCNAENICEASN